ncbi:hypothetical protein [Streptomyces sp. NRRL F-5727]|uniref:hypothetical protein n=1 Tax=Streptomyces sp. NRRL F-5727 TaxID=1463871 RepID=UPI000689E264|nr:hypothetical protein [Streptomyces sp. NRRL F-5727]
MRENDTPDRSGTGLSTDDIARSSRAGAAPGTDRDEQGLDSGRPPLYPGEAVDTPDDRGDTGAGTASDTGRGDSADTAATDTGTDTGTGARAGAASVDGSYGAMAGDGSSGTTDADVGDHRPAEESPRLMDPADEEGFNTRWQELQSLFVDDPRRAVHEADALVADVMQKLAATFADHRRSLEGQWRQGEDVDTESLRTALVRYRSFFHRLLSTGADRETAGSDDGGDRAERDHAAG